MSNIQIFNYEGSEIRTSNINGEPWFVAANVCKVLELDDTGRATERLDADELTRIKIVSAGQTREMIAVNEPGLYALILGSRKTQAKMFKRWVTHEVIPSIRKHGIYATDEILANPDVMIAVLQELKAEREHRKTLQLTATVQEQQIAEMEPKANYYDLILQNKNTVPVTQIAKDYGMSGVAFNKLLKDLGIQYKLRDTWMLYQNYANLGYTHSFTYAIDDGINVTHTYWTQKGRTFLYNLLKYSCGIVPVIERGVA